MKKAILISLTILFAGVSLAQEGAIEKYFKQYQDSEEFTKITVSSKMFELFTHIDTESEEDQEVLETISNLVGMKMIVLDSTENGKEMYQDALKRPGKEYEVLMTVEDKEEDLTFFISEKNGVIAELLLIGGGVDNFFVMTLLGEIDLKQLSKLSRSVQIDGMEHLEHIED